MWMGHWIPDLQPSVLGIGKGTGTPAIMPWTNALLSSLSTAMSKEEYKLGFFFRPFKNAHVMLLERSISRADQLLTADKCHVDTVGFSSFQLTWLLSAGCDDS